MAKQTIHPSITVDRVLAAAEEEMFGTENPGFCLACGEEQGECEPDAKNYPCEECGANKVVGAALLLQMIA